MEFAAPSLIAALSALFLALNTNAQEVYTPDVERMQAEWPPQTPDFPAKECALQRLIQKGDVRALRRHGWIGFAALIRGSIQNPDVPVFATWSSKQDAMHPPSINLRFTASRSNLFLMPPVQLRLPKGQEAKSGEECEEKPLIAVFFNPPATEHIQQPQHREPNTCVNIDKCAPSAGGTSKRCIVPDTSVRLWNETNLNEYWKTYWPFAEAPLDEQTIPPFLRESVAVKSVWRLVKNGKYKVLPVWREIDRPAKPGTSYPPTSWPNAVLIDPDPNHTKPVVPDQPALPGRKPLRVVSLNDFFFVPLDKTQIERFQGYDLTCSEFKNARVGDYAMLVGLHYMTKEIPDWFWATFWWNDRPGPNLRDRPSGLLSGKGLNYHMQISYSTTEPREKKDHSPHIAFNPYLEAAAIDGVVSNCMTCHRLAVHGNTQSVAPHLPITRGDLSLNNPLDNLYLKLDYIWGLENR